MKISVVVPTYKRDISLMRCLAALFLQDFDKRQYEIIVVDDAKSQKTKETVAFFQQQKFPKITYLAMEKQKGPAAARNVGWKKAVGKIIAFTDDDTVPDPHWLSAGYTNFEENTAGVMGKIVVPLAKHPTDFEKNLSHLEIAEFATANCFYTKEFLTSINGFDERFLMAWREDADAFLQLLSQRKEYKKCDDAIVVHPVKQAPWGVSLKEQKKSMYNALLYKKHAELYVERIQSTPPWKYYVIAGSFMLMLLSSINHLSLFVYFFGATWLSFTLAFFFQRIKDTSHTFSHIADMFATSFIIPFLSIYWRLFGAVKYKVNFL